VEFKFNLKLKKIHLAMPCGDSFPVSWHGVHSGGNPANFTLQGRNLSKKICRGKTKHVHFAGGKCVFTLYFIAMQSFKSRALLRWKYNMLDVLSILLRDVIFLGFVDSLSHELWSQEHSMPYHKALSYSNKC
jgi:hypothetical protein